MALRINSKVVATSLLALYEGWDHEITGIITEIRQYDCHECWWGYTIQITGDTFRLRQSSNEPWRAGTTRVLKPTINCLGYQLREAKR